MKTIIISCLLLFIIFSLSGCSINGNKQKDLKIAELEKQLKNDLFLKKEKCMNYKNKMLEFAEDYYKTDKYNSEIEINEIFYSKVKESCFFTTILYEDKNTFKSIFDFLGQELYMQANYYDENNYALDNTINTLKGE